MNAQLLSKNLSPEVIEIEQKIADLRGKLTAGISSDMKKFEGKYFNNHSNICEYAYISHIDDRPSQYGSFDQHGFGFTSSSFGSKAFPQADRNVSFFFEPYVPLVSGFPDHDAVKEATKSEFDDKLWASKAAARQIINGDVRHDPIKQYNPAPKAQSEYSAKIMLEADEKFRVGRQIEKELRDCQDLRDAESQLMVLHKKIGDISTERCKTLIGRCFVQHDDAWVRITGMQKSMLSTGEHFSTDFVGCFMHFSTFNKKECVHIQQRLSAAYFASSIVRELSLSEFQKKGDDLMTQVERAYSA